MAVSYPGGKFTLQLRVDGMPEHLILVQGARPVRSGVRLVQHFPLLGLLPPPVDGWSNITELYVARFAEPKPGTAIWIPVCRHIDGWTDVPKEFRVRPQPGKDVGIGTLAADSGLHLSTLPIVPP